MMTLPIKPLFLLISLILTPLTFADTLKCHNQDHSLEVVFWNNTGNGSIQASSSKAKISTLKVTLNGSVIIDVSEKMAPDPTGLNLRQTEKEPSKIIHRFNPDDKFIVSEQGNQFEKSTIYVQSLEIIEKQDWTWKPIFSGLVKCTLSQEFGHP